MKENEYYQDNMNAMEPEKIEGRHEGESLGTLTSDISLTRTKLKRRELILYIAPQNKC